MTQNLLANFLELGFYLDTKILPLVTHLKFYRNELPILGSYLQPYYYVYVEYFTYF